MSSRGRARRLAPALLVLLLAFAAGTAAGCGKKGPPLPPLRYVPAPTKDLAVQQRGTQLLLTFTYPKTTPSGAALTSVTSVEVWEMARQAPPPSPPATPTPAAPSTPAKAPGAAPPSATTPTPASSAKAPTQATTPTAAPPAPATTPSATPPATKPPASATAAPGGTVTTPAVGAPSVPPPPAALPGGFPPIDAREFEGMAKLKLKLQGPDVAAATFGDKLVIMLPLPEPSPAAAAATEKPASGTKTAATAKPAAGSAPPATSSTAASAPAAPTDTIHYYAIRASGPKNDRSAFSNQAALIPKPPPPPPGEVKVAGKPEGVEVSWTAPVSAPAASHAPAAGQAPAANQKILGFNVYRRDATAKTFGAPVRAALPDARSVVDATARFGESYIYGVATITQPGPLVESAIQSEAEIKYVDRYPPPVPADVVALAEAGTVRVVWRASAAPDLAGYLVYRRQGPAGAWKKLTEKPIAEVQYVDGAVATGATYAYRVTAVDQSGNESAPGEAQTKVQ
jgi:hypothetical protein